MYFIGVDLVGWPLVNIQKTFVSNHHVPSGYGKSLFLMGKSTIDGHFQ